MGREKVGEGFILGAPPSRVTARHAALKPRNERHSDLLGHVYPVPPPQRDHRSGRAPTPPGALHGIAPWRTTRNLNRIEARTVAAIEPHALVRSESSPLAIEPMLWPIMLYALQAITPIEAMINAYSTIVWPPKLLTIVSRKRTNNRKTRPIGLTPFAHYASIELTGRNIGLNGSSCQMDLII